MTKKRPWTESEVQYLSSNYKSVTVKELALQLNRTEKSVRRKLENLGLAFGTINYWTPEELEILRTHSMFNSREIKEKYEDLLKNRSEASIYVKMRELASQKEM